MQFNDYNAEDLDLTKSGKDLLITHSGNNIIKLQDFFKTANVTRLQLKYADSTTEDIFACINRTHGNSFNTYYHDGNPAGGYITGTDTNDIFVMTNDINSEYAYKTVRPGSGNDEIYSYDGIAQYQIYSDGGNDVFYQRGGEIRLYFNDATLEQITAADAWERKGNDLVIKHAENNSVTVKDYFTDNNVFSSIYTRPDNKYISTEDYYSESIITGTEDAESLSGTLNSDIIRGLDGNDIITGGKGNDIMTGGAGDNTYVFNKGDGKDKIIYTYGSTDTIKFNDVSIDELGFTNSNMGMVITYGNNDSVLLYSSYSEPSFNIIDKNDNLYHFIYSSDVHVRWNNVYIGASWGVKFTLTAEDNNLLIVGNQNWNESVLIEDSGAFVNAIIYGRGGHTDYYKDSISIWSGSATIMVNKQDSYTSISPNANTTIKFVDTTLDDVYLSAEPDYPDYPWRFDDYTFRLRYNSGESFLMTGTGNYMLEDYTGTQKTMNEHIGYLTGAVANGNENNNFITAATTAYGKGGNDIFWGCRTVYSYDEGQKNTTEGSSAKIYGSYDFGMTAYAQTETNEIVGSSYYGDTYYAYTDQKTTIWESTSGVGTDTLNFVNTSDTDKDGRLFDEAETPERQIHVLFNVSSTYDREAEGALYSFGNVSFVDNDNLALWSSGQDYKGITVTNNTIETINTTDGYTLTNANIADLASTVATWLSTYKGGEYGSVNALLAGNDADDIMALVAQFDTANWQHA